MISWMGGIEFASADRLFEENDGDFTVPIGLSSKDAGERRVRMKHDLRELV